MAKLKEKKANRSIKEGEKKIRKREIFSKKL
jgi:hypothetical protein